MRFTLTSSSYPRLRRATALVGRPGREPIRVAGPPIPRGESAHASHPHRCFHRRGRGDARRRARCRPPGAAGWGEVRPVFLAPRFPRARRPPRGPPPLARGPPPSPVPRTSTGAVAAPAHPDPPPPTRPPSPGGPLPRRPRPAGRGGLLVRPRGRYRLLRGAAPRRVRGPPDVALRHARLGPDRGPVRVRPGDGSRAEHGRPGHRPGSPGIRAAGPAVERSRRRKDLPAGGLARQIQPRRRNTQYRMPPDTAISPMAIQNPPGVSNARRRA